MRVKPRPDWSRGVHTVQCDLRPPDRPPDAMNPFSLLRFFTVVFLLMACAGCQQRAASKLQGRWVGRPDSAAARAKREAEKYGEVSTTAGTENSTNTVSGAEAKSSEQVTDWENYDVTIVMDFVSSDRLEMQLNEEQPVVGSWKVISTTPSGVTIEVLTESSESKQDESGQEAATTVRRRFELLLDEREGVCVGFQLTESGADAQVGALYFQRSNSESSQF